MNHRSYIERLSRRRIMAVMLLTVAMSGCAPHYYQLRRHGQRAMVNGKYGPACIFFEDAHKIKPRQVENLHDLGACSIMLARRKFEEINHAAAMRELDAAIGYYNQALDVRPSHQASIEGKNIALELKGQFDEALRHAEWAAEFVGPSARQYLFLAKELEERGELDAALLRYRQAVAIEPKNVEAHVAFARFLLQTGHEIGAVHHLQAAYRLNPLDEWVADQLTQRSALPPLTDKDEKESKSGGKPGESP